MVTTVLQPDAVVLENNVVVGARVRVRSGRIVEIGACAAGSDPVQVVEGTLLPGFVDLQCNGAGGRGVSEATPDALDEVAMAALRGGAAAFLPTLITAPFPELLEQITAVAEWIDSFRSPGAVPLGIHVEGPFLQSPGVHDSTCFVDPTPPRIDALLRAGRGRIALVTLAPGRNGAVEATSRLREARVQVALGHGGYDDRCAACVAAGARLVTHLFNAMDAMHHREPGLAGWALDEPALSCCLIPDGHHVHEAMVRNAFRCLGPGRTVLVTDSVAAAGMADGEYRVGSERVWLREGVVRDAGGRLAGSALTMAGAARNFARMVPEAGLWTLSRVAAANPARLIGQPSWGAIAIGAAATFCVVGRDGTLASLRI